MKLTDWMWFTGGNGCVGVVKCEDEYDGTKYYIGAANGIDERMDAQLIADWGAKYPKKAGDALFGVT